MSLLFHHSDFGVAQRFKLTLMSFFLLIPLMFSSTPAQAAEKAAESKVSVAIFGLKAIGEISEDDMDVFIDRMLVRLGHTGKYTTISRSDLQAILEQDALKLAFGCTDVSCLAEIGGAVGSDLLISGKVRYTDGQFLIFLSLINVKTVKTLKRIEIKAEGKVGGLPGLAQTAAEQLFDLEHSAEMEADGLKIVTPEEVEEQRLAAQKNHTRVFWASAALAVVAGAGGAFMMKGAFDEYDESERIYSQYQAATDPILISDLRQQASATNESAQSKRVTAWALLGLSGAAAIGSVVARLTSPVSPELDVVPGEVGFLFCPDGTSLSARAMWRMSW